jgi:hypothetical protein
VSGSRLNSKPLLKACELRGLKWVNLGYRLGRLRVPGAEEREFAAHLQGGHTPIREKISFLSPGLLSPES